MTVRRSESLHTPIFPIIERSQINRGHHQYDLDEWRPWASNLWRTRDGGGLEGFMAFFEQVAQRCVEAGLVLGTEPPFAASMIAAHARYDNQVPRFYWEALGKHVQQLFKQTDTIATGLVTKYNAHQPPDPTAAADANGITG